MDNKHKSFFLKLQLLNFFSAIIEVAALGSLALFVSIINDFAFIEKFPILGEIYEENFLNMEAYFSWNE